MDKQDNDKGLGKQQGVSYTDGDDPRRPAKFGRARNENDADAAYAAQLENNADPVYEVVPAPGEDPYATPATARAEGCGTEPRRS